MRAIQVAFRVPHFALLLLLLLLSATARAQAGLDLRARLLADRTFLQTGHKATLAVVFTVPAGWHIQSARPYDKYLIPAQLQVDPAPGLEFGPVEYPQGKDIPARGLSDDPNLSVYGGTVIFLVPVRVLDEAAPGPRTITATLSTGACNDKSCLEKQSTPLTLHIDVTPMIEESQPANVELFKQARAQEFYPAGTQPAAASTTPVVAASGAARPAAGVDVPLLSEAEQLALIARSNYQPAEKAEYSLLTMVLFALVGGMILNIMPCVLPVIPLKVLGLIQQAHGNRRLSLLHGLTFSAGIIFLFVVLAIVFRSAGLFYGEQFSSSAFIIALAMVILALALSMLNIWTINPPAAVYALDQPHSGYFGSFMNGVLATLLATPCSAPYLGIVLGWALQLPMLATVAVLALVGLGMALPYLVLAVFPAGLDKLPRAGRWTELIKQFLGLVMLGVALYLITRIADVALWPWVLFFGLLVGAACWAWGQLPAPETPAQRVWMIRAAVLVLLALGGIGIYFAARETASPLPAATAAQVARLPARSTGDDWQDFNLALLQKALAQGRPVVIDWTASWCINCRVVERTVLGNAEVKALLRQRNAVLLRADLTGPNPPAKALNAKLGGASIPVLAVFLPSQPERPIVLRDDYSAARLLKALR